MRFIIYHVYDTDGGFGDAVSMKERIGVLDCEPSELQEYLEKYSKKEAYSDPYDTLYCGELEAEAIDDLKTLSLDEDPIPSVRCWAHGDEFDAE